MGLVDLQEVYWGKTVRKNGAGAVGGQNPHYGSGSDRCGCGGEGGGLSRKASSVVRSEERLRKSVASSLPEVPVHQSSPTSCRPGLVFVFLLCSLAGREQPVGDLASAAHTTADSDLSRCQFPSPPEESGEAHFHGCCIL